MRVVFYIVFFFSSRRRHTRYWRAWSSDVCSSDLGMRPLNEGEPVPYWSVYFTVPDLDGAMARAAELGGRTLAGPMADRKRVVEGKRVDFGGRRIIKKKKQNTC